MKITPEKLQSAINYIDSWLDINFQSSTMPGMQVAISYKKDIIYSKAFGKANLETNNNLTTKHLFRIASHSKTFTATALLQLQEASNLNLDDPVSLYLPWFKSSNDTRVSKVTIGQLLNHTSGLIRDGKDADYWQVKRDFPDEAELKSYIKTSKLIYDSNKQFKYSNFGFSYLGLLIEAVSGIPYKQYVTDNIIKPLKLNATGPDLDSKAEGQMAVGYGSDPLNKSYRPINNTDTRAMAAATGFYSNAEDICRYFGAHFMGNAVLVSDNSKKLMQQGYWPIEQEDEKYGLGLANYQIKGWQLFGHGGSFLGYRSNSKFDGHKCFAVSVLTNSTNGSAKITNDGIWQILACFLSACEPSKAIEKFNGRFWNEWGLADIVAVGQNLYLVSPLYWSTFNSRSEVQELAVVDGHTLRIDRANGYNAPGEFITYKFDKHEHTTGITYAGHSMKPLQDVLETKAL